MLALPGGKAGSQPHACPERWPGSHRFCLWGCARAGAVGQGDRPHGLACPREPCGLTPPLLPIPSETGNSSIFHHTAFQPAFCLLFPARPQQWALSVQRGGASPKDGHRRPCRQRGDMPAPAVVPPCLWGHPSRAPRPRSSATAWGGHGGDRSKRWALCSGAARWPCCCPWGTASWPGGAHGGRRGLLSPTCTPTLGTPNPLMPCDGTTAVGLELIWHTARAGGTPSCHLSTSFPHHPKAGSHALAGTGHLGMSFTWHRDADVAVCPRSAWGAVPGLGWSPRRCPSPQSQWNKQGPRAFLPGLGGSPGRAS